MFDVATPYATANKMYPERDEAPPVAADRVSAAMDSWLTARQKPHWKRFRWIVKAVASHSEDVSRISDQGIREDAASLGRELRRRGLKRELVARVFALAREVAGRTLGMRHLDVQLIGGAAMLKNMVVEMETGEGKTLTATLPACCMALTGIAVHVITVNDYLAGRDADWMKPIYTGLGLTVGNVLHGMPPGDRQAAYRCQVTYCTNKELTFDYLRDRIVLWDRPSALRMQVERLYGPRSRTNQLLLQGLQYAIVDEADSVLVDEARTPLIISAESDESYDAVSCGFALDLARQLSVNADFTIHAEEHKLDLSAAGNRASDDAEWPETDLKINAEQRREMVRQALVALYLFDRDKHYLVQDGKVQIVDEYTGRLMADRSWEKGLHQLIELKEDCEVTQRKETKARISYQRFFRRYLGLSGMTGTAREVANELGGIYRLRVVSVPTNRPLKRRQLPIQIYTSSDEKWQAVVDAINRSHHVGRPVLVGTRSVEASEHLSGLLEAAALPHQVLNAKHDQEEADIIGKAGELGRITVATNMAGRGTDIRLQKEVAALGGLHVIATERHDAGRIDRQLYGRCGRQGDPGSFQAIISLDDELVDTFGSAFFKGITRAAVALPGRFWGRWAGRILWNRAQRRAERQHARMRQSLLKFDDSVSTSLAFTGRTE